MTIAFQDCSIMVQSQDFYVGLYWLMDSQSPTRGERHGRCSILWWQPEGVSRITDTLEDFKGTDEPWAQLATGQMEAEVPGREPNLIPSLAVWGIPILSVHLLFLAAEGSLDQSVGVGPQLLCPPEPLNSILLSMVALCLEEPRPILDGCLHLLVRLRMRLNDAPRFLKKALHTQHMNCGPRIEWMSA